uniref:Putative secreted protein n=1 Tax=Anopheles marajoara TaxID=58244 RepID=A0A2M4CFH1_9DIPT
MRLSCAFCPVLGVLVPFPSRSSPFPCSLENFSLPLHSTQTSEALEWIFPKYRARYCRSSATDRRWS